MTDNFYTFSEYIKNENKILTPSMEDYIEMIYRLYLENNIEAIRVSDLSDALNVKPPSTTKMIKRLNELDICYNKKNGLIMLTDNGLNMAKYLIERHNTVYNFLLKLGVEKSLHEQTEKIEHVLNSETLQCMCKFIDNNK